MTRRRPLKGRRGIAELWRLIESIDAGDVNIDDLPQGVRQKLGELFRGER
jgi:hypothetical protein